MSEIDGAEGQTRRAIERGFFLDPDQLRDQLRTLLIEYDRRGEALAKLTNEFADCGLCRQRTFIELNSRCEQHRDEDDFDWNEPAEILREVADQVEALQDFIGPTPEASLATYAAWNVAAHHIRAKERPQ